MRTKISLMLPLICSPLAFWGCGDDVTEVNENSYMAVLESGEKISKFPCDSTRVGDLLFVVDSSATFVCDGKGWASLKGAKGDVGATGAQGEKGDKGETGAQGEQGAKGDVGATGAQGEKGDKGETGAQGEQGEKGDKGATGAQGEKGDKGETGAQGEQGEKGKTGAAGTSCTASAMEPTKDHANGGVKITCGDKSYELWNGKDGAVGGGGKGDKGETGESCTLADDGKGSVKITCGEKTATVYKALCGGAAYDPSKQFCDTRDGQTYRTVTIGTQTWMAENLNYADSVKTTSLKGKSWCYDNDPKKCAVAGRLYTWAAAIDSVALANDADNPQTCGYGKECDRLTADELAVNPIQGICPSGWHLPSYAEWGALLEEVGGSSKAGKALKSASGWYEDGNGKDSFGFSALPAGLRINGGSFDDAGYYAYFWSASQNESNSYYAYYMYLNHYYEYPDLISGNKNYGFSVRCIQN